MAQSYTRRINLYINGKEVRNDVASIRAEFGKLSNQLAHTTRGSEEYNQKLKELQRLKGMLVEHNQAVNGVTGTWGKLGNMVKGFLPMIGLTFGASQVVSFAKEIFRLGGEVQGVSRAFQMIADENYLEKLRQATHGTVSDLELMKNAVKASNFQIPLESLATLFEFAAARAQQTGDSVDFLVQSIILGIGRKSPLILDNLGISSIMLRERLKGVSAEAANIGDVAQVVSDIAGEELAKMGGYAETNATKIGQVTAMWLNFKAELSQSDVAIGTVSGSIGLLNTALSQMDFLLKDYSKRNQFWNNLLVGPAAILQFPFAWKKNQDMKAMQQEAKAVIEMYNGIYAAAKEPLPEGEGSGGGSAQKSLLEIQKALLEVSKQMPETTEAEIAAKNRKIQVVEQEIKRLESLGKVEAPKAKPQEKFKGAQDALRLAYTEETNILKEQLYQKKITQETFQTETYALELAHLLAMRELYRTYGESTVEMDGQILDKKLAWQTEMDSLLKVSTEVEKSLADEERQMWADLENDFTSYTQGYVDNLNEQTQSTIETELSKQEVIERTAAMQAESAAQSAAAAVDQAQTAKEAGRAVLNVIRQQIKARIAEAVATQAVKVLAKVPFPFNIAAAAVAAGAVTFLFNKLIPEFEEGGFTSPGQPDQPAGVVHSGEWVAPQWMVKNPNTAPIIGSLESFRKNKVSLNPAIVSGAVPFATGGYAGNGESSALAGILSDLKESLQENSQATKQLMTWKPKVYSELIKKDLETLNRIEINRSL